MKNKILITFTILLVGVFLSALYGPWWAPSLVIISMVALLKLSATQGMILGSLTSGLVFLAMTLVSNAQDRMDIISKVGELLGGLSPVVMILISTFLGLITGLLSGWLGSAIGDFIKNTSSPSS